MADAVELASAGGEVAFMSPWPEKQREAIFLSVKRKKGLAAAKRVMHEAGYGGGAKPKPKAKKRGKK